jgi:hypothetical protein
MQLALFGNAVDRFFLTFEEPPLDDEDTVTEAIYEAALCSRMCGGEPRDYERYDYQEQDAPMSSIKNDFSHGYHAGYENNVSMLLNNRDNESFCLGYTAGRQAALMEHKETTHVIFESPGMSAYSRRGRVGT